MEKQTLMIEEMDTVVAPAAEEALAGVAVGLLLVVIFCS
jgi:hypothetical protein